MAFASNVALVSVNGTYVDYTGAPVAGQIKFTLNSVTRNQIADQIIIPSTLTVTLDANGSFTTLLPATNDPDLVDAFTYQVEESFSGGRTYSITLPAASPTDRTNLILNPSYETNTTSWGTIGASSAVRSTAQAFQGSASILLTTNGSTPVGVYNTGASGRIPVTAGTQYTASIYVLDVNTSVQYYAGIEFYNSLTGGSQLQFSQGTNTTVSSTNWTRISVTATAPVGALGAVPVFYSSTTPVASRTVYFDAALFESGSTLGNYFDPSVDTRAQWSGTAHASTSILYNSYRLNATLNPTASSATTGWNVNADTGAGTVTRVSGLTIADTPITTAFEVNQTATTRLWNFLMGDLSNAGSLFAIGRTYTLSFYARVVSGATTGFAAWFSNGPSLRNPAGTYAFSLSSSWQRISYTFTATGQAHNDTEWHIDLPTSTAGTFQFTGFLIEESATAGKFFDGTYGGGTWSATSGYSASTIRRDILNLADLAPGGTFPLYYAYASASSWTVLDSTVQTMDGKIDQTNGYYLYPNPTYALLSYRTYAEIAAAGYTYAQLAAGAPILASDWNRGNLVVNPSFETDTSGWSSYYVSTLARVGDLTAPFGNSVLSTTITNTGGGNPNGTIYTSPTVLADGTTVRVSAFVRGTAGRILRFGGRPSTAAGGYLSEDNGGINVTLTTDWQRVSITYTISGQSYRPGLQFYITPANFVGTDTFYVDAVMIEAGSTLGTYIEGDSYVTLFQTQATNAQASSATATLQLGVIQTANSERLDDFLILGLGRG